jgi:SAM-dependent methyltransferase
MSQDPVTERILRAHLRELPWHRVITRSLEARILHDIAFPRPILDVGCGDGHFASVVFPEGVDIGIDPGIVDAREASARGVYRLVVTASSLAVPFPDRTFASVLSNCVLEHIADLDTTLAEIARVLRPGGLFVATVISDRFSDFFIPPGPWTRLGLSRVRDAYVRWFNRKARHFHLDSPQTWIARLARAGLSVERWRFYSSPAASAAAHRSHYWSLPFLVSRRLTGRWVPFPGFWERPFWRRRLERYVGEPEPPEGSCIALICRKPETVR